MTGETMEDVEPMVIKLLSEADVDLLVKVCSKIPLVIPPEKAGKRTLILKLLMKYLHSDTVDESEDGGLSTFLMIYSELEDAQKKDIKVENSSASDLGNVRNGEKVLGDSAISRSETSNSKFLVQRLREFKINGTVGGVDQKDTLSYTSLSFQMKKGREAGYWFTV